MNGLDRLINHSSFCNGDTRDSTCVYCYSGRNKENYPKINSCITERKRKDKKED